MDGSRRIAGAALCVALGCSPGEDEDDAGPLPPRDCPNSELSAPLCHRSVDAGSLFGWSHYRLGFTDELRDGVRPFLGATLHPLSFALFSPLDVSQPLVETPGPFPSAGSASQLAAGDFDDDGANELAVIITPTDSNDASLIILDGQTLETKAVASTERGPVFAIDIDGDQRPEIVTVGRFEVSQPAQVWSFLDGALVEVAVAELPFEEPAEAARGDFDGDSQLDLALTASDTPSDTPPILLLRGGSVEGPTLIFETIPQPGPVETIVAADIDGDDDHELFVFHAASAMTVMDWSDEGLVETESIILDTGSYIDSSYVNVRVGEDEGRPDWLIISSFQEPGAPSTMRFDAAVFPGRPEIPFIRLDFEPSLVADYDDDGLSDFTIYDSNATVYLSADEPSP